MKILLVEDDQATSSILADTLSAHRYTVNQATDGQTGLELAGAIEYDLILLDIIIPKLDGVTLCKQLRSQGYQSPILLLTAKDSTTDRVVGLDAGADDYVVKPFEMDELMARIRAVLRRSKAISASVITWETVRFDPVNSEVTCGDRPLHLTPKEYCLLELFLLNPKRIFSRRAILDRLWDFAESPGEETISTHIKCLRRKFRDVGAPDPIETVHGLGYRLRPPAQAQEATIVPAAESASAGAHALEEVRRQKVEATTAKVWKKFRGQFVQQAAVLEQAVNALSAGTLTIEGQLQAKQEAHRLAGSLGIFGLMQGSQLARELETLLQADTLLPEQTLHLSTLVTRLQQELHRAADTESEPASSPYAACILIVDDDLMLAERIRVEATAWGLHVEVATDLDVARKVIAQSPPDIILLDLSFPSPADNGLILLKELTQRIPRIPVLVFTGKGDLEDRLAVSRLGGCMFLQKPLPTYEILKAVTDVLSQNRISDRNRVLVMHPDPSVQERLSALLQPVGVQVIAVEHPPQFWQVLTATAPNLLILDFNLPGLNGIEVCQAVRSDFKWHHLPILFLSANTDADILDRVFAAGADDYIGQSTDDAELANRIIRRLRRTDLQHQ